MKNFAFTYFNKYVHSDFCLGSTKESFSFILMSVHADYYISAIGQLKKILAAEY